MILNMLRKNGIKRARSSYAVLVLDELNMGVNISITYSYITKRVHDAKIYIRIRFGQLHPIQCHCRSFHFLHSCHSACIYIYAYMTTRQS